jgi:hypothetical protein
MTTNPYFDFQIGRDRYRGFCARRLIALAIMLGRCADSDLSRPGIPTRSRPPFRFDAGRDSETKPATIPI